MGGITLFVGLQACQKLCSPTTVVVMKKALFVTGGWEGHHPQAAAKIFSEELQARGFETVVSDSLDAFLDAEAMSTYDLIVPVWTMGEISDAQLKGVMTAVENGAGLGGFHGGMNDAFRVRDTWQFMVGSQFVGHPGNIIDYTVDIAQPDHPLVKGLGSFAMHSEQYYMHVDPGVNVLATTTFSGEHFADVKGVVMPVAYTKRWHAGKVFFCALGHEPKDFDVPECREMIIRGLLWAAR